MIFQNRGRPQGNINKDGSRDFLRSRPPARQHNKDNRDFPKSIPNIFELLKILESSLDALDRLYRADGPRVVEAVVNNSFQKG